MMKRRFASGMKVYAISAVVMDIIVVLWFVVNHVNPGNVPVAYRFPVAFVLVGIPVVCGLVWALTERNEQ